MKWRWLQAGKAQVFGYSSQGLTTGSLLQTVNAQEGVVLLDLARLGVGNYIKNKHTVEMSTQGEETSATNTTITTTTTPQRTGSNGIKARVLREGERDGLERLNKAAHGVLLKRRNLKQGQERKTGCEWVNK